MSNELVPRSNETLPISSEADGTPLYQMRTWGSMTYILDEEGNKVSDGFHQFQLLEVPKPESEDIQRFVLGSLGSVSYVLSIPKERGEGFHIMSPGYHSIFAVEGVLYGQLGSRTEEIPTYEMNSARARRIQRDRLSRERWMREHAYYGFTAYP